MKKRIFTLMMAFLAIAGNAVWGQSPTTIDVTASQSSDGKITAYSFQYSAEQDSRTLEIKQPGDYTIQGKSGSDNNSNVQISISTAGIYNITLDNVRVDAYLGNDLDGTSTEGEGKYPDRCAFEIGANVTVNLDWKGSNTLWSGPNRAGINVKENAKLILKGTNNTATLIVGSYGNGTGTNAITYGAGIGGDKNDPDFGTIIIESGKVEAYSRAMGSQGSANGAGIGGGYSDSQKSAQGTIIIKGGDITAQCNVKDYYQNGTEKGAGIGGGFQGTCEQIIIIGKEDATVKVQSYSGADIGVGDGYTGSAQPEIIIGKWDKDATISVAESDNANVVITDENYVDGYTSTPSASGIVTMPDNMQIYVEDLNINDGATFNAYHLDLQRTVFNENHNVDWSGAETAENYYLGKGQSIEMDALKCNATEDKDLFLGWYNSDNDVVTVANDKTTFTAENTSSKDVTYYAVWVESEHPIVVETETTWQKGENLTPKINYVSKEKPDVLNALTFQFGDLSRYSELENWKFENNQILGTTKLKNDDTYEKLNLTATVKLGDGATQDISIPVYIVEASIINTASINTNQKHVYTGNNHNGSDLNGQEHLLSVQMTKNLEGKILDTPVKLTEGSQYRIYSYSFEGKTVEATKDGEESVELIDAGEYSNITIEALQATISADLDENHGQQYTIPGTVTVAQRPLEISFSLAETEIEEGQEPNINMVNVQSEANNANANRGLVKQEKPRVSYEIGYKYNDEQTEMTVFITDIEVADVKENGFKKSNYDIKYVINDKTYKWSADQDGEEDVFPDDDEGVEIGTIPVTSSSTGGNFNDKRYQLFLANKDYLKTDEKTVEYYEDLKLELFSRHNKKYTDAGGSFTVWYEKDGVANPGGYRLFWSKSGERGDYQEVKFDEVSGYYQIRNVQSDVYVKIYDADGFPVANEAITAQDFRAYAQPNKIIVITPQPTDVQIISMAGAVVATDKVTGQREFANLAEGVYIVRMGETIVKLQVRN